MMLVVPRRSNHERGPAGLKGWAVLGVACTGELDTATPMAAVSAAPTAIHRRLSLFMTAPLASRMGADIGTLQICGVTSPPSRYHAGITPLDRSGPSSTLAAWRSTYSARYLSAGSDERRNANTTSTTSPPSWCGHDAGRCERSANLKAQLPHNGPARSALFAATPPLARDLRHCAPRRQRPRAPLDTAAQPQKSPSWRGSVKDQPK